MKSKTHYRSLSTTRSPTNSLSPLHKRPLQSNFLANQQAANMSCLSVKQAKVEPIEFPSLSACKITPKSPVRSQSPGRKTPGKSIVTLKTLFASNRTCRWHLEGESVNKEDSGRKFQFMDFVKNAMNQSRHAPQPTPPNAALRSTVKAWTQVVGVSAPILIDEGEKVTPDPAAQKRRRVRTLSTQIYNLNQKRVMDDSSIAVKGSSDTPEDIKEASREEKQALKDIYSKLSFRKLIFSPTLDINIFRQHLVNVHKSLFYAAKNLRNPPEKLLRSKQVYFQNGISRKAKTLLLDLDETLVYLCPLEDDPDVVLTYETPGEPVKKIPLKVRPYLKEFIARLGCLYEIAIFSASAPQYAQAVADFIDKDHRYIHNVITRDNCMATKNGFYIKDLRIIKNRDLKDMIIVDNFAHSFGLQIDNGVPILEFTGDKQDEELKYLADYLMEAYHYYDVREYNRAKLKLKELAEEKPESLLYALQAY